MSERSARLLGGTALAGFVLAFWWGRALAAQGPPGLLGGDIRAYYLPVYEATSRWIASGRLPLWNPYQLTGVPWLAALQAGVFYPAHALYLALPTHAALAVTSGLHLVVAVLGGVALGRRLGLAAPAALLGALLFPLRGNVQAWLAYPAALEASAWLPLGAAAVADLAQGRRRRGVVVLATCGALSLLAGYPQVTVYSGVAWSTLLVALLVSARVPRRRAGAALVAFAAALALAGVVAAAQLLPSYELARESARGAAAVADENYQAVASRSFFALGPALRGGVAAFGLVNLALVPAALLCARRRALVAWAALLGGAAYLLASGRAMELVQSLPVISWFRYPIRALVLSHFCVALLGALALDALLRADAPGDRRRRAVAAAVTGATAGALSIFAAISGRPVQLAAGAALVAALAVPFAFRHRRTPGGGPGGARPRLAAAGVALGAAVFELAAAPPATDRLPYFEDESVYRAHAPAFERLARMAGSQRVVWLGALPQRELELGALAGVRFLDDYEPLSLGRHADYFQFLWSGRARGDGRRRYFSGRSLPPRVLRGDDRIWRRRRLLDLAAVRLYAATSAVPLAPGAERLVREADLVERDGFGGLRVFESPHALPRAWVTYAALPAPETGALLQRLSRRDYDPLRVVYVEAESGFARAPDAPARGAPARIVRDDPTVVEVEAELAAPGLLALADSFYPGWRADVDGAPVEILATNHVFRGVVLPAGRHRVRFSYRPASLGVGAISTLLGVCLLAALAAGGRGRGCRAPGRG